MNPWRGLSGLPRASWWIACATFVNRAGVMVRPFMILYLTNSLGFSVGFAGSMIALYGGTTLVAAPLSGWLSDRLGARLVLRSSLLVAAAAILAYPFASGKAGIAAATVVFALFNEMPRPALMTLVAEVAPEKLRKQAFVLSRLAINLGLSIGPAVGGLLADWSYRALFFVDAGASLAAALLLLRIELPRAAAPSRPTGSALAVLASDRALLVFFAATVLNAVMFFQHESTLSLYMTRDLKLQEWVYGLTFTLNTLLIVLIEVELNTRLAHWSHKRSLVVGAALTAVGFGGIAFAHGWLGISLAVVVWTFGEMIAMPAMSAFVVDLASPTRRGLYMGTLTLAFGAGFTMSPVGTRCFNLFGARPLWLAVGGVGLLSTALYACLPRRRPAASREAAAVAEAGETAAMDAAGQ
jgi:MFS family permease